MRSTLPTLMRNLFFKHPTFNVLFVTSRCNLKCKMCFLTCNEKKKELTTEEVRALANSLPPQWYIMITGGEPFLRNDIDEVAAAFYDRGAVNIHFSTNATLADRTLEKVRTIAGYAKDSHIVIVTSIDGPEALHDDIRRMKGAYQKTVETTKELIKMKKDFPNIGVGINFTLSSYNQEHWKEVVDFAQNEVKVDTVNIGLARGETQEADAKNVNLENYWNAHRYLIKSNRRTYFAPVPRMLALFKDVVQIENIYRIANDNPPPQYKCLAGRVFNVITEEGDVYPCEMLSTKMGNLRDVNMDFMKIWKSEKAKKIRAYIEKGECLCTYECAMTASLAAQFSTVGDFINFVLNYKKKTEEYYDVK